MTWKPVPLGLCVVTGHQGEAVWADLVPVAAPEDWEKKHVESARELLADAHRDEEKSSRKRGEPFSVYGATRPDDSLGVAYWKLTGFRQPERTDLAGARELNRLAGELTGEPLSELVVF